MENNFSNLNDIINKRKRLKYICRNDYNKYIRDIKLKNNCELCNSNKELILHHEISFQQLLDKTIEEVGIDKIMLIREIMLGNN